MPLRISDRELWDAANLVAKQDGADAKLYAASRII